MRACVLTATGGGGGIDKLEVTDVPDAHAPQAGEVRVAIRAAALNHLDLVVVEGVPRARQLPHIVGADRAGAVEAVGSDLGKVPVLDHRMIHPSIFGFT